MKQLVLGILAHVDAGKTTLSEAMLYLSGSIRRLGRVDKKDTFFDTYRQERERGITIFSRQARLRGKEASFTLLDTPGHTDFSAEMERTLQVLDYAILLISGSDKVQGHTYTLWKLLKRYKIPTFLFVNKLDQPDTDKEVILRELRTQLSENCVDFSDQESEEFFETIAVSEEETLNEFLETGKVSDAPIRKLIRERKIFPCFSGSALKLTGVEELLQGLCRYTMEKVYPHEFGARIFKITRDNQGNRLTHMKITGGSLKARETLTGTENKEGLGNWQEKVNQIRIYSGDKFEIQGEAKAGEICAVTGLTRTWAGEGLGCEKETVYPELTPVLSYALLLPEGCDAAGLLPKFRQLEEEEPQLHITWEERSKEIRVQLMGQVQIEILKNLIQERFGLWVEFGTGSIVYKETIADVVEGVGHFEPLRHYAEVHLLLEPGKPGSGIQILTDCSEEVLDRSWQRQILTCLEEKEHIGVLTGAPVTDMKITLKSGRANQKHTEGGDFRQAACRAVRQGLMQAESVLLEPYWEFILEVPENAVGRAMADIDRRQGTFSLENAGTGMAVLKGMAPMALLLDYPKEVAAYTRGTGKFYCSMRGYYPCHNTEEVLLEKGYSPLADTENPAASVFCAHGAGVIVEWNRVQEFMHLESCLSKQKKEVPTGTYRGIYAGSRQENEEKSLSQWIGQEEIDAILNRTSYANRKENKEGRYAGWKKNRTDSRDTRTYKPSVKKEDYLLVDGYNVIFAGRS